MIEMSEKPCIYMKHTMSCLADQAIEVQVDRASRELALSMDVFDSALVIAAVLNTLPDLGVIAYRDDSAKVTEAWLTPTSRFRLVVVIASQRYRAQVVRLFNNANASVTLAPYADGQ